MQSESTATVERTGANPVNLQPVLALEQANRIRFARADVRRALTAARTRAASFAIAARHVEATPETLATWSVGGLILACRRSGPSTLTRVLVSAGVSETRPLGRLTARERRDLAAVLRRPRW